MKVNRWEYGTCIHVPTGYTNAHRHKCTQDTEDRGAALLTDAICLLLYMPAAVCLDRHKTQKTEARHC